MTVHPVLQLALLLVLALLVARLWWRSRQVGLGVNMLLAAGTHLIAFGVLLGPVTGVISEDVLRALTPFLVLGLGWTGMLIGAQLDRQQLKRFSRRFVATPLVHGAVAFLVALVCAWVVFTLFAADRSEWRPTSPAVLTLAAITAVSTPAVVAVVSHSYGTRGPVTKFLLYLASLDGVVGLAVVAVVFAFHHAAVQVGWIIDLPWVWLLIVLLAGVLVGLVFLSLTRAKPSPDELVLFLGGTILFGSGIAYALSLPPLVVCFIAGMLITNLSRFRRRVYTMLATWEKPIYGLFLILAGAMLRPPGWGVVPLVAGLLGIRFAAKLVGGWAALRTVHAYEQSPRWVGLGLYAHGGLALAIALGYAVNYRDQPATLVDMVVAAVVITVVLSEVIGPFFLRDVLIRVGEIRTGETGRGGVRSALV